MQGLFYGWSGPLTHILHLRNQWNRFDIWLPNFILNCNSFGEVYDDFKSEVHISIPSIPPTSYGLQLSPLPGGTIEDYAYHIYGCLDSIVKTYASYLNLDLIYAKSTVIHNLLSDRVAVNYCVVQSLQSALDIELLELKCNVYPLDGIAKKCNTSLKLYDTEHNIERSTFSRECCASELYLCNVQNAIQTGKG